MKSNEKLLGQAARTTQNAEKERHLLKKKKPKPRKARWDNDKSPKKREGLKAFVERGLQKKAAEETW